MSCPVSVLLAAVSVLAAPVLASGLRFHTVGSPAEDNGIEFLPKGGGPYDVVFTAVLNRLKDRQKDVFWEATADTINPWAGGVQHFGMHGVVIHDGGYSKELVRDLGSRLNVSFLNPLNTSIWRNTIWEKDWQGLTINDQRFFLMGAILEAYKDRLGYVLLTDTDVDFGRDPAKLMRSMDSAMNTSYMFVQDEWRPGYDLFPEETAKDPTKKQTAWDRMKGYYHMCFEEDMPEEWSFGAMYSCGAIGGHVTTMIEFLHEMRKKYNKLDPTSRYLMCDMPTTLKTVMESYHDNVVSGFPFNGKFKHPDEKEVAAVLHQSFDPARNNRNKAFVGHSDGPWVVDAPWSRVE